MGLGVSWYRCPVTHLVFYLVPALLPLRGSAPLAGASAYLTPVCWSTPEVGLEGSLLRHLVFSHVPCSSSGPAACAAFPAAGSLGGFPVTGCLPFCFPGDVGWASALPFFFCASPAPLACRGRRGSAPCVRVLQLRWCLLGLKVRSPCCPSLTLGWVCFWPVVSQAFVGCEGGLGCPSRFVTALGSWTAYSGRWMVQVPAIFLNLTLGSSLSLPVLAAGLKWLSSLRGFAMEGVDLVLFQVLVGLPSWCCCASGLLGPVVFLLFLLGHLSEVRSVFFLSPRL